MAHETRQTPLPPKSISTAADVNEATSDIELIAKETLEYLINKDIMPTPSNYSLYFDQVLGSKSDTIRIEIESILDLEEELSNEKNLEVEKALKKGLISVKSVLNATSALYKNIAVMSKLLKERYAELKNAHSSKDIAHVLKEVSEDIVKLSAVIKVQNSNVKEIHEDTLKSIKRIDDETIYDPTYNMYNKKYLMSRLRREYKAVKALKFESSFLLIEQDRNIGIGLNDREDSKELINKNIGLQILKSSKRSDEVAHYGHGKFAMLLRHTNLQEAKKTAERLVKLVEATTLTIGSDQVKLKINIGVSAIKADKILEEDIVLALDELENASKNQKTKISVSDK
ncbi:MAG: diguanylate cyclase [Helicobacteraceae bacterium]|nr:diguanylate cyclase [Helicobacteraceae bacterium]